MTTIATTTHKKAIQDYYPDSYAHCHGCGRLNETGTQLKSYWQGTHAIAHHSPSANHTGGVPGFAYGGLIASLLDCHGTATAAAGAYAAENRGLDSAPFMRFVTGSLTVDYLKPTPLDCTLELRGHIEKIEGRKVTVALSLSANNEVCAKGSMLAVRLQS